MSYLRNSLGDDAPAPQPSAWSRLKQAAKIVVPVLAGLWVLGGITYQPPRGHS